MRRELAYRVCECGDTPQSAFVQEPLSLCGRADARYSRVVGVLHPHDELTLFERRHQASHCGRSDLFGRGELAERQGAATEHEDGERRELRRREVRGVVLSTKPAQKVDSEAVDAIRNVRDRHS